MTRDHGRDSEKRAEPWASDCTPSILIGLGAENVPMAYRGLIITSFVLATLALAFFGTLNFWR